MKYNEKLFDVLHKPVFDLTNDIEDIEASDD